MQQDSNTLVAVYGSLRQGHGNHRLLAGYECLATELSVPEFTMHSLGGFPALTKGEFPVVIELYKVDALTFKSLDRLEGYPNFYNRREILTSRGNAWVYYINDLSHYNTDIVESGDWSEYNRRCMINE